MARDQGRIRLPSGTARPGLHLSDRSRRHDLRHAQGAVPRPGPGRVPCRTSGARAALRRAGCGRTHRGLDGGLGGPDHRQGLAVIWAVALWGAAITFFGLSGKLFALALFFLAFAGAADVISAVFRGAILQLSVPDALRGRLSAIHIMVVT